MGHSIYLADDEKSIRELLHSFLASDGYTVRSFESGDALLEAFRQEPAELVILDIMMPGTDGLTVCRELRAVSDIPIILLTAKDSELDYVMGISQGSDDYLTKPFRPTILLMKVKALLRRVEMDRGKTAAEEDELQKDELILGMMMERAKVALPPRTSTYDVVIIEYLKKAVPVEAASWEEAKMLVNEAWDNGTYVLTADDFAGVSFTLGR